jgi:hypothetical protein
VVTLNTANVGLSPLVCLWRGTDVLLDLFIESIVPQATSKNAFNLTWTNAVNLDATAVVVAYEVNVL